MRFHKEVVEDPETADQQNISNAKSRFSNLTRNQKILISILVVLFVSLITEIYDQLSVQSTAPSATVQSETLEESDETTSQVGTSDGTLSYNEDPGSYVWQRNLDMTGTGNWVERAKSDWQEDVGQTYLFVSNVNCLFYVFDENAEDKDVMRRAYQWLSQYSGIHIAGSNWLLMDSSYGEKCTGPVTDTFGGYRVN
ncbi:hypothetical protein [Candidatus Planktophila dulcis]|uniref:hypothetical protein n=1 Tax=Candidatus Planktophila dulcis TaxID=1884914 RepID=UPI003CF13CB2